MTRLYPDGSFDPIFYPDPNDNVTSIAVQADGKILIGGSFTTLYGPSGLTRNHIARLSPEGTVDTTFNPNADNYVYSIAVQADGKILVGGWFYLHRRTDEEPYRPTQFGRHSWMRPLIPMQTASLLHRRSG